MSKENPISQRNRVEMNPRKILEITGGVVLGLLAFTACSPIDNSEEAGINTTVTEEPKDANTLFNPNVIELNDDTTPLDYNCAYWVKDGQVNEFSGPLPSGTSFNLFVTIDVVSDTEAKIGPYTVTEGQRFGFYFTDTNDLIPMGQVRTIQLGQVEFVPAVPERGANDCPTDKKY